MSNYATTTEIQTFFKNQWSIQGRSEKIAYEGYTDESAAFAEGSASWVRLSHNEIQTNQITLQNRFIARSTGTIFLQCFQRAKTGTDEAEQMADAAIEIFRRLEINGASSGLIRNDPGTQPNARRVGVDPAGWFQINVTVPYIRDVHVAGV